MDGTLFAPFPLLVPGPPSSLGIQLYSTFFGALSTSVPEARALPGSSLPAMGAIIHAVGILFMLVAERRLSSRTLDSNRPGGLHSDIPLSPTVAADDVLAPREIVEHLAAQAPSASRTVRPAALGPHQRRVYLFIIAFVVGEVAGGVGSGYVALAPSSSWKPDGAGDGQPKLPLPSSRTLSLLHLVEEGAVQHTHPFTPRHCSCA